MIFLAVVLLAVFWLRTGRIADYITKDIAPPQKISPTPEPNLVLTDPQDKKFQWKYAGSNYVFNETLYGSLYQYYQSQPKAYQYQGELPADWEENYYAIFLEHNGQDNSIAKIATAINNLGIRKNLKDDQIVELTVAFVQSIPYDDVRAQNILAGNGGTNYPYETLYEGKGVCSDKSFLLANLLKEMGYGTALFVYNAEKHMAVGIECSKQYSSYNSGYCYAETTATGFKIGVIPDIDPKKGSAVAIRELGQFNSQLDQFNVAKLGEVKIFAQSQGKTYNGIIQLVTLAKEADSLRGTIQNMDKDLKNLHAKISAQQDQLNQMNKQLEKLKKTGEYAAYNDLVEDYNRLLKDYKNQIKSYNTQITDYNQKVNRYNTLIKSL